MQNPTHKSITILGVRIDDLSEDDAIAVIAGYIASGEPHQVVTVNPEFIVEAQRNPEFRAVLANASMATADGFGIMLEARRRGRPLRSRVTGVALVQRIAEAGARHGWKLFLLGAAPGIAEQAAARLQHSHSGLAICGCYAGSPRTEDAPAILERIQVVRPDVLLVAYGHPRQDLWIAQYQPQLRIPVAIGVGGTFDELAGIVPQAPAWMHRLGLKWIYRLIRQPQRWRRIIDAVPIFLWNAIREQRR